MIQWGTVGYFVGEPIDWTSFACGLSLGLLVAAAIALRQALAR